MRRYAPNGDIVILRGVNLPLLDDWSFPGNDSISEIEQTGANAVRIQWYIKHPHPDRPPYTVDHLDDLLAKCSACGMIPILMLADLTCEKDAAQLNLQLIPWWTSSEVITVLQKHARYLVINLANELGVYRRAKDQVSAYASYVRAYATAIASIRRAGLTVPIMIDAPDCGTSLEAFASAGHQLIRADPLRNVLLSAHAYWAAYDGIPLITPCLQAELPIVFGEIANKQDDQIDGKMIYGHYDLDGKHEGPGVTNGFTYQFLLSVLQENEVGWLAWSWGPDWCHARQMSSDRAYDSLTEFGKDLVGNAIYGFKATARRSNFIRPLHS